MKRTNSAGQSRGPGTMIADGGAVIMTPCFRARRTRRSGRCPVQVDLRRQLGRHLARRGLDAVLRMPRYRASRAAFFVGGGSIAFGSSGAGRRLGSGAASSTIRRSPLAVSGGARTNRSEYRAAVPASRASSRQRAAQGRPRGNLVVAEDMTADHGDNPVDHHGERHRRHRVGDHAAGRGGIRGRDVHIGRRRGAGQDQRPLGPARTSRPGTAPARAA